jgi:hypothetical protein
MATADRSVNAPTPSATTSRLLLLATFVAAIVLSASLLFMWTMKAAKHSYSESLPGCLPFSLSSEPIGL